MIKLEERFCTLCGSKESKSVKYNSRFNLDDFNETIFSARRSPDKKHFQIMKCEKCGILFSDPACDSVTLSHLYQEGLINYDKQEQYIFDSYAPILDDAMTYIKSSGDFVEIGGGTGFMLKYAQSKKFDRIIEIEPSEDAKMKFHDRQIKGTFINSIFTGSEIPESSASLCCFFQMLDHVPDPLAFVRKVRNALKVGGVAICVTHNTSSVSARLLGRHSPIFDIEHTYLFNLENISKLFEAAGFEVCRCKSMPNRYPLEYWVKMAPIPQFLKSIIGSFVRIPGIRNLRPPFYAGNLAIIARKK